MLETIEPGKSRPTRARGLKHLLTVRKARQEVVAPHAGAWIETIEITEELFNDEVAPHAGAWIETIASANLSRFMPVAPHAGAWIETNL